MLFIGQKRHVLSFIIHVHSSIHFWKHDCLRHNFFIVFVNNKFQYQKVLKTHYSPSYKYISKKIIFNRVIFFVLDFGLPPQNILTYFFRILLVVFFLFLRHNNLFHLNQHVLFLSRLHLLDFFLQRKFNNNFLQQ